MIFFRKKKKLPRDLTNLPEGVQNYFRAFERQEPEAGRYVVFDLETTGLDSQNDHILSFAFLKVKNGEIMLGDRFEGFLKLDEGNKMKASEIHQITRNDTTNGLSEQDFILQALKFIGTSTLVGHHVAFDTSCLNQLMHKHFDTELQNKTLDTAKLGARLENVHMSQFGGQKALKNLDSLCKDYGITPEARHSATGDTYTTSMLFLKLLKRAHDRGIKNL